VNAPPTVRECLGGIATASLAPLVLSQIQAAKFGTTRGIPGAAETGSKIRPIDLTVGESVLT